jgi:hypothetical protein
LWMIAKEYFRGRERKDCKDSKFEKRRCAQRAG